MNNSSTIEQEIEVLKSIAESQNVRQRELSRISGVSLGMINAILKRLVKKGLLIIQKINNRTIRYAISPQGMKAITERSYKYFKRTIRNVAEYKIIIEKFIDHIHLKGYAAVILVGNSDIDFIIEHICSKKRIAFKKGSYNEYKKNVFFLYSEEIEPENGLDNSLIAESLHKAYLSKILIHL